MKIAAYSMRIGGPRSYEHGVVDIGAVVLDGDEFSNEFYKLCAPDDNQSYRPGALRMFGTTLDDMARDGEIPGLACLDFMEWADDYSGVWTFGHSEFPAFLAVHLRRELGTGTRFQRSACLMSLYQCLRALGARGPVVNDYYTLMDFAGVDCRDYSRLNALEQAKLTALTMRHLRDKLAGVMQGDTGLIRSERTLTK